MREKTSGSWRSIHRSLRRDELLIDAVSGLGEKGLLVDPGAAPRPRAAPRVALLDARPQQSPCVSSRTTAGSIPVTPTAATSAGESPLRASVRARFRRRWPTIAPDPPRPSRHVESAKRRPRGEAERRSGTDQDADRRGRTDVEAENERHGGSVTDSRQRWRSRMTMRGAVTSTWPRRP